MGSPEGSLLVCTLASFTLSSLYVLSLYIWNTGKERDHPDTIKRRFISASSMIFISPPFVYFFADPQLLNSHSVTTLIGVRQESVLPAIILPLILTCILFMGPIAMSFCNSYRLRLLLMPEYWTSCFTDLIWWRNHVVAPFTEEFTFRACMLPILLGCHTPANAVWVAPLFFGTAHLHHMAERIKKGQEFQTALFISLFQMTYTTMFGMYSAFLFIRTGHLIAPVVVHGFCNYLGFPDFAELLGLQGKKKTILCVIYVLGVVVFFKCLFPLTDPSLFANTIYTW